MMMTVWKCSFAMDAVAALGLEEMLFNVLSKWSMLPTIRDE